MTQGWQCAGFQCAEPVEVHDEPHLRQGYRQAFDLTLPDVRKRLLYAARGGPANVWWIAAPCTSFCDWFLQNNGARSFEFPQGGTGGVPLKPVEEIGNMLGDMSAELFVSVMETGGFPLAESTAKSSRYPKMWDLPKWQAILARPDVDSVEFPMCAFGLGPDEDHAFYHHKTRLVFPKCPPLAAALSRRCPGIGPAHRHVPLKGSRGGARATRCTEAGAHAEDFVKTIVEVLSTVLAPGGQAPCGGQGDYEGVPYGEFHPRGMQDAKFGMHGVQEDDMVTKGTQQGTNGFQESDMVTKGTQQGTDGFQEGDRVTKGTQQSTNGFQWSDRAMKGLWHREACAGQQ